MPTYRYECASCGAVHEEFHAMADDPPGECPECGGKQLERLIGRGGGVILKGSGFYTTDYRSDSYRKAAKRDREGGTKKESKDKKPEGGKTDASGGSSKGKGGSPGKK